VVLAEIAVAAGDREGNDDAIAALQFVIAGPDFNDLAHELVPENVSRLHRRHVAIEQVQIRAADRARGDADDCIARIEDRRVGHALDANVIPAVPHKCLHAAPPRGCPFVVGTSPVSRSALNRRRSSRIVCAGSSPNSHATAAPILPAGGSYCMRTWTSVSSCPVGLNRTEPALTTSAPWSVRQPIDSLITSLMISASHSTVRP